MQISQRQVLLSAHAAERKPQEGFGKVGVHQRCVAAATHGQNFHA
ncbi:hypothetical protein [Hymenobacter lapidiphilus]|nr:hypothetical protein [Hymenobacter lapidiphilus]